MFSLNTMMFVYSSAAKMEGLVHHITLFFEELIVRGFVVET